MIISFKNKADKCTNRKTKKATVAHPKGDATVVLTTFLINMPGYRIPGSHSIRGGNCVLRSYH